MNKLSSAAFIICIGIVLSSNIVLADVVPQLSYQYCEKSECYIEGDVKSGWPTHVWPRCRKSLRAHETLVKVTRCSTPNVWIKGELTANNTTHPECLFNKKGQNKEYKIKVRWECPQN